MPTRPTPIAAQRARPTRSPRKGTDSAVMSSGAMKKIAYAPDNGSSRRAKANNDSMAMPITPRSRCRGQRIRHSVPNAPRHAT